MKFNKILIVLITVSLVFISLFGILIYKQINKQTLNNNIDYSIPEDVFALDKIQGEIKIYSDKEIKPQISLQTKATADKTQASIMSEDVSVEDTLINAKTTDKSIQQKTKSGIKQNKNKRFNSNNKNLYTKYNSKTNYTFKNQKHKNKFLDSAPLKLLAGFLTGGFAIVAILIILALVAIGFLINSFITAYALNWSFSKFGIDSALNVSYKHVFVTSMLIILAESFTPMLPVVFTAVFTYFLMFMISPYFIFLMPILGLAVTFSLVVFILIKRYNMSIGYAILVWIMTIIARICIGIFISAILFAISLLFIFAH